MADDDRRSNEEEHEFDDDELGSDLDSTLLDEDDEEEDDEEDDDEEDDEEEDDEEEDDEVEDEDEQDDANSHPVQNERRRQVPVPPVQNRVVGGGQLGLQDTNRARVGDNLLPNYENFGSPSMLSNPSSPLDSPGSRTSTNARENRDRASDLFMSISLAANVHHDKIREHAFGAMDELLKMASIGEPLWQSKSFDRPYEILNGYEYLHIFGSIDETFKQIIKLVEVGDSSTCDLNYDMPYREEPKPKPSGIDPLRIEASRDSVFVRMNAVNIVDLLMNVKQWAITFVSIVTRAMFLGLLSAGSGYKNYNGMLQVMSAEFNLPTVLVPPRECQFIRYCRQVDHRTWAIVDVSLESLFPYPSILFRRRPSGCIIQELPQAQCSKVTWVEHVEADNSSVHRLFDTLVNSGFAFCATRWLSCITQYYEELVVLLSRSNPVTFGISIAPAGQTSILKLAERMLKFFCHDINASALNPWKALPIEGGEDIKYMTRVFALGPARELSYTVAFTTSVYLPCAPKQTFDFLRDEKTRPMWDMISYGQTVEEVAYVMGTNPFNRVSILQSYTSTKRPAMVYLQKIYKHETGSYVIHAPMDPVSVALMLNGGNSDWISALPSGFVILPDRLSMSNEKVGGTILTLVFHIIDNSGRLGNIPAEKADTIKEVIIKTVHFIKHALTTSHSNHPPPPPPPPPFPWNQFPGESSSNPQASIVWKPRK